jgi:uncharacterized protein YodC (DUF2158 family)
MSETIPFKTKPNPQDNSKGQPSLGEATSNSFSPGTVVWLMSGSPAMTVSGLRKGVSGLRKGNIVSVDWFDVEHYAHRCEYDVAQLTTAPMTFPSSVVIPNLQMENPYFGIPHRTEKEQLISETSSPNYTRGDT